MRHPCQSGHRCTCHSAGPSNKTTTSLIIAALVAPVLAAPAPVTLPFLYPTLQRRVTDAGQAPDDPSEGFAPEHIQLSDLRKAGLPYKFVYDPTAEVARDVVAGVDVDIRESSGAWVIDDAWQMHGKRFGPLSATATADITDDPLPTQTEAVATASSSATPTTTSLPSVLAIESTLPTGWADDAYRRSGMYAIPLVVSFSVVIALMIGSLIGALAIRRDRSRSRRRKKRVVGDDDSVTREKVVRKGLAARVGRALKRKEKSHSQSPRQSPPPEAEAEPEREDVEVGEHAAEAQRDRDERSELAQRVKSWARRSASWKVQARVGMRRRIGRGKRRVTTDNDLDNVEVIREDREGEERVEREEADADAGSRTGSRAPTPVERTSIDRSLRAEDPASSPVVPTYSSTSSSSAAGPSTPRDPRGAGCDVNDAHADAAPSDEPAYDDPGAGDGLPPAYRRGEGRAEVRRGKMPMRSSSPDVEPQAEVEVRRQEPEQQRAWTALDAYAFGEAGGAGEEGGEVVVTAHVATDDKRVLERLQSMRGAPEDEIDGQGAEAPREEDVFVVDGQELGLGSLPGASVLPSPPSKAGTGPVARYDEADLSLPRYLDGAGSSAEAGLVPSAPPEDESGLVPSAPPAESVPLDVPSAPPLEDDDKIPSAPTLDDNLVPSAPALDDGLVPSAPPMDDEPIATPTSLIPTPTSSAPSAPTLHHTDSSSPLLRR